MNDRDDLSIAFDYLTDQTHHRAGDRGAPIIGANDHLPNWREDPSVIGVGIGLRQTAGDYLPERCLKIFVARKLPRHRVERPLPSVIRVPGIARPIALDVQEFVPGRLQQGVEGPRGRNAIRSEKGGPGWGSYGCILTDRFTGRLYLLSNAHVLAPSVNAAVGDRISLVGHTGKSIKTVATLAQWTTKIPTSAGFPNVADAAIAEVIDTEAIDVVRQNHPTAISCKIRAGMKVFIDGARSGSAESIVIVDRVEFDYDVHIPSIGRHRVGFRDQVYCRDFTNSGDSGSCVRNEHGAAVGLHFWGSDGATDGGRGELSVFTPMKPVLDVFKSGFDLELSRDVTVSPHAILESREGRQPPPVDDRDDAIDVAARTIFGEARGESDAGRRAVAEVIYNRAIKRSERFGTSVEQVCRKPFEFGCWNLDDPNRDRILRISLNDPRIADSLLVARDLVDGRIDDLTAGADHYHRYDEAPRFSAGHTPSATIDNHLFFNSIPQTTLRT